MTTAAPRKKRLAPGNSAPPASAALAASLHGTPGAPTSAIPAGPSTSAAGPERHRVVVGISGINAVDNPGPGIGVARSLRADESLDVTIVGLSYDAMEPGNYMDWVVDRSFIVPYPSGNGEDILARLYEIQRQTGMSVIIPNLDAELPFYIKYADELERHGLHVFLPTMTQFRLRGKDKLDAIAKSIDLDLPMTEVVTTIDALVGATERIGLPVMVKGPFYQAHRAYTTQEAVQYYHKLVAEWGYPVIVQEVVSGDELNVIGLGDGTGETLGLVGIKKVGVTKEGKMWSGVTVKHQPMLEAAAKFVRVHKWRGPFELECIVHGETVYLVEVNPRFPAWTWFATGVGVNLPSRLVRRMLGEAVPPAPPDAYDAGKLFVRYSYELVTDITTFQQLVTQGMTTR